MNKPITLKGKPITRVLAYLSQKHPRGNATLKASKQMKSFEAFKQNDSRALRSDQRQLDN